MEILYFFLPAIIFLGIVTSYEDIRKGKIKNKWILFSLVYSLLVMFAIVLFLLLTNQVINFSYITDYFINIAISLVFGFSLWYGGLWSAGDAKLFLAYAALLPLSVYSNGYISYFPSFTLMINAFAPLSVFLLIKMIISTNWEAKFIALKNTFSLKNFSESMVSLFGFSLLLKLLFSLLNIRIDIFLMLLIVFTFYGLLGMLSPKRFKQSSSIIAIVMVILNYGYILSLEFLYYFLYILVFFIFFRYFIFELSYDFFSKQVDMNKLRPGMIPAEIVYKKGRKYAKEKLVLSGLSSILKKRGMFKSIFDSHYLTKEDIEKLKKLHKEGKLDSRMLRIYQTTAFAPFLLFGVILTIIFKGNFLMFVINLF